MAHWDEVREGRWRCSSCGLIVGERWGKCPQCGELIYLKKEPKIDRKKSVFEVQKADVQRLLGEENRPPRPDWLWSGNITRIPPQTLKEIQVYIEHIEQAQIDALAVLDNMEGEAVDLDDYRCPKCGWAIGFRAAEPPSKGLTLNQICNCGHSLYTHPEGSDTGCIALDQSKGLMCECEKFTPAEEPKKEVE
jgi:predicted RNA-binding Zn-ribbon protein involved in translation (DUF1610 family)